MEKRATYKDLMNGPEYKRPFRSHRRRCWIILKLIFKKWNGGRHGPGLSGSGEG